jgi:cellulose synthase (UDP-forming)
MTLLSYAPLILVISFFMWIWSEPKNNNKIRTSISVLCMTIGVNYLWWRLTSTVLGHNDKTIIEQTWVFTVWLIEFIGYLEISVFLLIMSRYRNRSIEADLLEKQTDYRPSVDIFIPTYNEPLDVLEKTIIGAKSINYPHKRVYILDDGRRSWLREFCLKNEVEYVTRNDNSHAKAGNMNHGLRVSNGDLVAIFDADFVPHRNFLTRTVGFFQDPTTGIVQTPQHFFNRDIIQSNLNIGDDFPDEQRLFFDEMAASRDAWDAAFCCGSCSITRRSALDEIGGFPTASITEDLLTTLTLLRKNYKTIYLNERLSMGLAADTIKGFFIQRQRWCQGAIQCMYLPEGPLGPGLSWGQRILFFPISWLTMYPTRFMMVLIPLMYFYFDLVPLFFTSIDDLIFYQLPMFLAFFLTTKWLIGDKYMPLVSVASSIFASVRMIPTIIFGLIKPFGKGFKVTPKGSDADGYRGHDSLTFWVIFITNILTIIGIVINVIPEYSIIGNDGFFPIGVAWALLNVVIMILACMMCFESKNFRKEERFKISKTTDVLVGQTRYSIVLDDCSVTGAKLSGVKFNINERLQILIEEVGFVNADLVRYLGHDVIAVKLNLDQGQRERLISVLFSGKYSSAISKITSYERIIKKLWHRGYHQTN